jgi:hypothetical protein
MIGTGLWISASEPCGVGTAPAASCSLPSRGATRNAAIARFGWRDAEHVANQVPSGRTAPAVDWRTPSPAFTEGVIAVDEKLLPAADQVDQQLGPSGASDRVVYGVAEEGLSDDRLPLGMPPIGGAFAGRTARGSRHGSHFRPKPAPQAVQSPS